MDEYDFECKDKHGRTVFQACFSRLLSVLSSDAEHENLQSTSLLNVHLY